MTHRVRAKLEGSDDSTATYARIPPATMRAFDGRIRVPVRVTLNGVTWRTTICNMGAGPMIGVSAAVRKAAGIERGDGITFELERDTEVRTVELPPDFARALRAAERRAYDAMSYSHRKEYVQWIDAAKKPETRLRRIEKAREKLRESRRP
ncbi:MAG: YdeI/OmpD-associated family protein [Candidatus Tumulicola sp.]